MSAGLWADVALYCYTSIPLYRYNVIRYNGIA